MLCGNPALCRRRGETRLGFYFPAAAHRLCCKQIVRQGGTTLKGLPEERAVRLAQYMIETNATVRQTAARFGISKSTVHKDITTRLKTLNAVLYERVQTVLAVNKQERHIRGGMATREKYRARAAQQEHGAGGQSM